MLAPNILWRQLHSCHFIPAELSALIHQAIPHSKFVEISGGGHIPFIEAPDRVTQEVLGFVRTLGEA